MPGRGPTPKENRVRRNTPVRDWIQHDSTGWQHGKTPSPPSGLTTASRTAWKIWMRGWVSAHWTEGDLPGLRILILLYDQVERGEFQRAGELRLWLDTFGLSPKGATDRRWRSPEPPSSDGGAPEKGNAYRHLRTVEVR